MRYPSREVARMDQQFARGARVKKPLDKELTLYEASFVMCSVAHREGYGTEERFIEYMRRAWVNYVACGPTDNPRADE